MSQFNIEIVSFIILKSIKYKKYLNILAYIQQYFSFSSYFNPYGPLSLLDNSQMRSQFQILNDIWVGSIFTYIYIYLHNYIYKYMYAYIL